MTLEELQMWKEHQTTKEVMHWLQTQRDQFNRDLIAFLASSYSMDHVVQAARLGATIALLDEILGINIDDFTMREVQT